MATRPKANAVPKHSLATSTSGFPRFKTAYNATAFPLTTEKIDQVSETAPNQTMSVLDIMKRFTGMTYPQSRELQYYGEEFVYDIEEFQRLDLTEQQEIIEQAREKTKETIRVLRRKNQIENEKQLEEKYRQQFADEIKQRLNNVSRDEGAGNGDQTQAAGRQ